MASNIDQHAYLKNPRIDGARPSRWKRCYLWGRNSTSNSCLGQRYLCFRSTTCCSVISAKERKWL